MNPTWFLVGAHYEAHHSLGYRGICGDWWPFHPEDPLSDPELYRLYLESRQEMRCPSGSYEHFCTNESVARRCFEKVAATVPWAAWIELSFAPRPGAHGIDFGDVHGNWSIVANEILCAADDVRSVVELGDHQLFASVESLQRYFDRRDALHPGGHLEEIGSYDAVWVRIVASSEG